MVVVVIGGNMKRSFTGLLGRFGIDQYDNNVVIGKLDSNDNKTQIQLIFKDKIELSILRDSIDMILNKLASQNDPRVSKQ